MAAAVARAVKRIVIIVVAFFSRSSSVVLVTNRVTTLTLAVLTVCCRLTLWACLTTVVTATPVTFILLTIRDKTFMVRSM